MNVPNIFKSAILLMYCFSFCPDCFAQSGSNHRISTSTVVPAITNFPRNSLNSRQQQIERILDADFEHQLDGVTNYAQLVVALRQLGLPVFIDQSAWDDSWSDEEPIRLLPGNLPLYDVVQLLLDNINATIAMRGNKLTIISKDVASDPEYFTRIIYDINFTAAVESFVWDLKSAIEPSSWDDTNGDGVAMLRKSKGQQFLIVSQNYEIHRSIQEYLRAMARMELGNGRDSFVPAARGGIGSTVVELPSNNGSMESSEFAQTRRLLRQHHSGGVFSRQPQTD